MVSAIKLFAFQVNYTRKVQHFAAYLVPLLFKPSADCHCAGTLEVCCAYHIFFLLYVRCLFFFFIAGTKQEAKRICSVRFGRLIKSAIQIL